RMGNPLAHRVEHILRQGCPFPGDNVSDQRTAATDRFHVHRTSVTHHVIWDS
ncbi:hypothetical protein OG21DRAFT_1397201, partial [Imleria badia]